MSTNYRETDPTFAKWLIENESKYSKGQYITDEELYRIYKEQFPKKYRLLHDLVGFKEGDIFIPETDNPDYYNVNFHLWHERIHRLTIEANPKSFEEIKEQEKIEISRIRLYVHDNFLGNGADSHWYQFSATKPIGGSKFPAIKEAIERVVNCNSAWYSKYIDYILYPGKYYTQKELDSAERRAFEAGQRIVQMQTAVDRKTKLSYIIMRPLYLSFEDYKAGETQRDSFINNY